MEQGQSQNAESLVILPFSVLIEGAEWPLFVNVQKVVHVVDLADTPTTPIASKAFASVAELAGLPLPVIDLEQMLAGLPGAAAIQERASDEGGIDHKRIIAVDIQGIRLGLLVHRTRKICRFTNDQVLPPPDALNQCPDSYVSGVIKDEQGFRYMLDVEAIMEQLGISSAEIPERAQLPYDPPLSGKKILVVEDSKLFRNLALRTLTLQGAEVRLAKDGQQGLQRLLEGGFHLAVVDIEMPVMNGIEMVRRYRQQSATAVPILFHSSLSNPSVAADIAAEGLGDFILKFEHDAIVEKIRDMVGG